MWKVVLCFGPGEERGNFLSLVCIQQIENRALFCSVSFLLLHSQYSSSFHYALLITLFKDTATSITKLLHLLFESLSQWVMITSTTHRAADFLGFSRWLKEHVAVLSSLQSVPSVGLSGCYLCPLSLRKRAGHKMLLGLWENFCLPNSLREGCMKMGFSENWHALSPGSHQSLVSSDSWQFLLLSDNWK